MIIETAEYNAKLIAIFFRWYWVEMPLYIITQTRQYIKVISKIFSFVFLLKTFFQPWKNQSYEYPKKGFDLHRIFEVWTSNMISRLVGAFVKGFTILLGLLILIVTSFGGIILCGLWIFYPLSFLILIGVSLI